VVNSDRVAVRRSTGTAFAGNKDWTQGPPLGDRGSFFADVSSGGEADAIVVNNDRVTVRRSTGTAFGLNNNGTTWCAPGSDRTLD